MTLEEIENKLVDRIQKHVNTLLDASGNPLGIEVKAHPDDPENYTPLTLTGEILVRYDEGYFNEAIGNSIKKDMNFAIVFIMRSLRTHSGVYRMMEETTSILHGWSLTHGKGQQTSEAFIGERNGYWYYRSTFKFPHVIHPYKN